MRTGKVSEAVLKRSVLKKIKYRSPALLCGPQVGKSCARLSLEGREQMVSAEVCVSGGVAHIADQCFYRLINDVSAASARLSGLMVTLLFPEEGEECELKFIAGRLAELAREERVDILGGHTEVAVGIEQPILALAGIGFAPRQAAGVGGKLMPGQDIVMTKWAGAAWAAGVVREARKPAGRSCSKPGDRQMPEAGLVSHFSDDFLSRAEECFQSMSSVRDAEVALAAGATALCSAGEEGVFGALWKLGEASGVGLRVEWKKIPIKQETVEICEYYDCNPYEISSDGALLAGTPDGQGLAEEFRRAGIPAAVIGTVTDARGRVVVNGEEERFLVPL